MSSPADPWVRVLKVKDGDSVIVRSFAYPDDVPYEVRLYGIDAPESDQLFGSHSKEFLSRLALDDTFCFHFRETDRYGRLVGELYRPGQASLNLVMVQAGWAHAFTFYGVLPGVREAETSARAKRLGVWSVPGGGVRPWYWRNGIPKAPAWFPIPERRSRRVEAARALHTRFRTQQPPATPRQQPSPFRRRQHPPIRGQEPPPIRKKETTDEVPDWVVRVAFAVLILILLLAKAVLLDWSR